MLSKLCIGEGEQDDRYSWRSDLSDTKVLDEWRFVEYTKGGFATTFTVTALEPCRHWESGSHVAAHGFVSDGKELTEGQI